MGDLSHTSGENLRPSHGLEQLFAALGREAGASVLDLGECTQANVTSITGLGHRLFFEDLLRNMEAAFSGNDAVAARSDPARIRVFLDQVLQYPPDRFDAIFVWDTLEHLTRPLLDEVMPRLHGLLKPQGALLACFHAEPKGGMVPVYSFRIVDQRTIQLHPRGTHQPVQWFNNRSIEKLFQGFGNVKFFLTRDSLREVIVRK